MVSVRNIVAINDPEQNSKQSELKSQAYRFHPDELVDGQDGLPGNKCQYVRGPENVPISNANFSPRKMLVPVKLTTCISIDRITP